MPSAGGENPMRRRRAPRPPGPPKLAERLGIPTPLPRRWRKMLSMRSTIRGLWLPDCTARFVNETGAPEFSVLLFFFVFQAGFDVGHDVREENHQPTAEVAA